MALVVFLQEDEDVASVYCNLKIFYETAPRPQTYDRYSALYTQDSHSTLKISPFKYRALL